MTTLRKEIRTCRCGEQFTAYIKVVNGQDVLDGLTLCHDCLNEVSYQKHKSELLTKLPAFQLQGRKNWLDSCNLPGLFRGKTFANFEKQFQPKAFDAIKGYQGRSMVLLSPNLYGVGKTHLVAALMNDIIEKTEPAVFRADELSIRWRQCPVYLTAENILLGRLRQTFNRSNQHNDDEFYEETEEDVYRELEEHHLLIIDDVGKVRPKDYSFLQGVYFRIIDSRYTSQKPIILTTNLDFAELENHIGGACADRLLEMAGKDGFIKMSGKSYRKGKA